MPDAIEPVQIVSNMADRNVIMFYLQSGWAAHLWAWRPAWRSLDDSEVSYVDARGTQKASNRLRKIGMTE
jgi:hypothetical protein